MSRSTDRLDSADGAVAIVLDQDVSSEVFALNVAQSGFIAFIGLDGKEGRVYVAAGIVFPLKVRKILTTGTTAQEIVGLV